MVHCKECAYYHHGHCHESSPQLDSTGNSRWPTSFPDDFCGRGRNTLPDLTIHVNNIVNTRTRSASVPATNSNGSPPADRPGPKPNLARQAMMEAMSTRLMTTLTAISAFPPAVSQKTTAQLEAMVTGDESRLVYPVICALVKANKIQRTGRGGKTDPYKYFVPQAAV